MPAAMSPRVSAAQFNVNYSFMFVVKYKDEIVFIGRYVSP